MPLGYTLEIGFGAPLPPTIADTTAAPEATSGIHVVRYANFIADDESSFASETTGGHRSTNASWAGTMAVSATKLVTAYPPMATEAHRLILMRHAECVDSIFRDWPHEAFNTGHYVRYDLNQPERVASGRRPNDFKHDSALTGLLSAVSERLHLQKSAWHSRDWSAEVFSSPMRRPALSTRRPPLVASRRRRPSFARRADR